MENKQEKEGTEKVQDMKVQAAWNQHNTDEWMLSFNLITPEYLQKMRYMILLVFTSIRQVDVSYDPEAFVMTWTFYFKTLRPFFKRRKKVLSFLYNKLQERFPDCRVTIEEGK